MSLGLTLAAVALVLRGWHVWAAVFFSLALNHKQMALYYALAFFAHMLGRALRRGSVLLAAARVVSLGVAVVGTFAVLWAPWLGSAEAALQVARRLFPFARGLFEDYVANFWCATNLLVKWKRFVPATTMPALCAGVTLLAVAPAVCQQVARPSRRGFVLCMMNCALAFFLFSFQVHEKSILLPLLPATLLAAEEPLFAAWAQAIAAFSMWPLLKKDGQGVAYCALLLLHAVVSGGMGALLTGGLGALRGRPMHLALCASLAGAAALHAAEALVPPPASKPFLHDALNAAYSAAHVLAALAYGTWRQWQCPADEEEEGRLSRGKAKVA